MTTPEPVRDIVPPVLVHVVALLPTYNNAATLGEVIDRLLARGIPVLVINDGSTDATAGVLAGYAGRIVADTLPVNGGKGDALRRGFRLAGAHGYTHAVTIDTDGQHDPGDVPRLIDLARADPAALVLGTRDTTLPGYPKINRLGRWSANTLVRWESGLRVDDSQCGLRVYPLAGVAGLFARFGRYGFETEILTRCAWAGIPVVQTPVGCAYDQPGGRVSHFRPWVDSFRAAWLHVWLLTARILHWLDPRPALHAARQNPAERGKLATGLAVGVFIANTPLIGLHTIISVFAAKRFGLQPLAVIAGSHASTPPLGPLLFTLAVVVGHLVLHGHLVHASAFDPRRIGYLECLRRVAVEWTVGGLLCGLVLAALTYAVTRGVLWLTTARTPPAPASPATRPA